MKKFKPPKTIRLNPTFNWKPPKPLLFKPTKKSRYTRFQDFDQDNVPNIRDCRPYNRHRQHLRPSQTTHKRLSLQRIYVTDEPANPYKEPRAYHISSREAKQYAPKARQQLLGVIKKYPSVLGDIERKQPKAIAYSSVPADRTTGSFSSVITREGKTAGTHVDSIIQIAPTDDIPAKMKEAYESTSKATPKDIIREHRRETAETIFHELKHQEQQRRLGRETTGSIYKEYKHRYDENPLEIEAQAYATSKIAQQDKPPQQPTGTEITKTLNLDSDFDGVPDSQDCKPGNPYKQHISRTMKERIRKLPIVTSDEKIMDLQKYYYQDVIPREGVPSFREREPDFSMPAPSKRPHILSKEASPIARKRFLSAAKKYPGIVGEIERTKPPVVVVTSGYDPTWKLGWVHPVERDVYIGTGRPSRKDREGSKARQKELASMLYHELKHAKQVEGKTQEEIIEEYERYGPEEYEEIPMEKEATEYSKQEMKKYYKGRPPTGKQISEILELEGEE